MPRITSISSIQSQRNEGKQFVFAQRGLASSPGQLYEWNQHSGWGARTDITLYGTTSQSYQMMATHPSGSYVFIGTAVSSGSGYLQAVSVNRTTGALTNVASAITANNVVSVDVTPTGRSVVGCYSSALSPYIEVYAFTTTFGSKFANPATTPSVQTRSVKFSPTGESLIVGMNGAPLIAGYPWSDSTGFGTKFANPGTAVTGTPLLGQAVDTFRLSDGTLVVAVGTNATPYLNAYQYTDAGGFGTKYTAPAALIAGVSIRAVRFVNNGVNTYIVANPASTPFVAAIGFSTAGFGSKLADPATAFSGTGYGFAISHDGQVVFAKTSTNSPSVAAYKFGNAWGTKYADPSVQFSSTSTDPSICFIRTP